MFFEGPAVGAQILCADAHGVNDVSCLEQGLLTDIHGEGVLSVQQMHDLPG
jgi:hypothetical protein